MSSKQPPKPVNRQQRRASVKEAQKVKLPDDRKPPSIIILMFGMVAILGIIMFGRACYFDAKDPSDLSGEEQRELATGYGTDFAAALEDWRVNEGGGTAYPSDPVDAYKYMDERPINPFTGKYAFKAYFKPHPIERQALADETPEDAAKADAAFSPDQYGNYVYFVVDLITDPAEEPAQEHGGYYLMVYGDGSVDGVDINMDGLPDRVIGFWASHEPGDTAQLEPIRSLLERDQVACEPVPVEAGGNELQAKVNQYYQAASGEPEPDEPGVSSAEDTAVSPEVVADPGE